MHTLNPHRYRPSNFDFELPIHEFGLNPNAREWYPSNNSSTTRTSSSHMLKEKRHGPRNYRHSNSHSRKSNSRNRRKNPPRNKNYNGHRQSNMSPANSSPDSGHAHGHPNRRQQKFGYRSKQNKIDAVLTNLQKNLAHLITINGEKLRGPDTVRIDVKRFSALQNIERLLEKVNGDETINIIKADFPVSQKNRFQKKGFIAYIKCASIEEAERLKTFIDVKGRGVYRVKIALEKTHEQQSTEVSNPSSSSGSSEREESSI